MSSDLHVPTKTPPLTTRLYHAQARTPFRSRNFIEFRRGYANSLSAVSKDTGKSVEHLREGCGNRHNAIKRIGVKGGNRFFSVAQQLSRCAKYINAASSAPSAHIQGFEGFEGFPRYDLHLAVAQAGGPLAWACTDACLWMMCQMEWAWGQHLRRFIDGAVEDVFDDIADGREQETGEYERRTIKRHQQN